MDTSSSHRITVGAAVVAAAWALPMSFIHLPTAGADPCPDVEVVFARGTTEPPGAGGIGQAFIDSLRSQLGGRSVGVYAVNYPAAEISTPAHPQVHRMRAPIFRRWPQIARIPGWYSADIPRAQA